MSSTAGEGAWLVWFHGKLSTVDNFSDKGPFPKAVWWVKVRTAAGLVGWTTSDHGRNDFYGQDSLAG